MGSVSQDAKAKMADLLSSLPPDTPENTLLREELLADARKLTLALEQPHNVIDRVCFGIWETICAHIGMDMGIFKLLDERSPRSGQDIIEATTGDAELTKRILRCMSAHGLVSETGDGKYSSTMASKTFASPKGEVAMRALYGFMTPGWLATPAFLKETEYQNPASATKTAFAKAYGKEGGATFWEIIRGTPFMADLNGYMSTYNEGHADWMDIYPVEERLVKGAKQDPEAVLMIDAGGGHGHQALALRKRCHDAPGRVVVQDLPHGIPKEKPAGIEYMVHDLMGEQPIKGARCYYFRYVIHNWPQATCVEMLTKIRESMEPGYSKVIINEWIIPERGASKFMTAADLNMMSLGGSMERTLELHREYLEAAGLKISGVWKPNDNISECVIEAEVA